MCNEFCNKKSDVDAYGSTLEECVQLGKLLMRLSQNFFSPGYFSRYST